MNEQTEKNINEAIDWLQQVGGSVQDFAVEQAPLYCREVVAWNLQLGQILLGSAALTAVFFVVFWIRGARLIKRRKSSYDDDGIGHFVACVFLAIGTVALGAHGAYFAGKATTAPRLVIVEHLRGLK